MKEDILALTLSPKLKSKYALSNSICKYERRYFGIDFVTRQKSYADKKTRPLTFEVGHYVYLKVSPMKGEQRFGVKRKLAPRYVGPYQIIERK